MAETPVPILDFAESCGDCGQRKVNLPVRFPEIGDDFDWLQRDYDSFRLFMLEELAGRFPERTRWTPADIEVIFVEALSVVLDQLSDSLDRSHTEAYLESARQPESVRRLLSLIGYDASRHHYALSWKDAELVKYLLEFKGWDTSTLNPELNLTKSDSVKNVLTLIGQPENALGEKPILSDSLIEQQFLQLIGFDADNLREALDLNIPEHKSFANRQLEKYWYAYPHKMDEARLAGPSAVHQNRRMVTLSDYRERVEDHPLVLRASSQQRWTGSWSTIEIISVLSENSLLDEAIENSLNTDDFSEIKKEVDNFHWQQELASVDWHLKPTFRSVIKSYVDRYRMAGQEVWLKDAKPIGLNISISARVNKNYFQTEVQQAIAEALGTQPGGFFEPGKLSFGQDLYASDLIECLMGLDGVAAICLNRFKRVGDRYPDESGSGLIKLHGSEIGRCDNIVGKPAFGYWRLSLHGGQKG